MIGGPNETDLETGPENETGDYPNKPAESDPKTTEIGPPGVPFAPQIREGIPPPSYENEIKKTYKRVQTAQKKAEKTKTRLDTRNQP